MSRELSVRGLAIVTLLSATVLVLGVAFAFRPETVLETIPPLETLLVELDPALVILCVALTLVLLAPSLGILGRLRTSAPRSLRRDDQPPDAGRPRSSIGQSRSSADRSLLDSTVDRSVASATRKPVGASFDRAIELATAYETESEDTRTAARDRLVDSLRPLAADALAARDGVDRETATAAIETGSWTDDVRAAAFLASEAGPSMSLQLWLFDLLTTDDPFERTLEQTITEIEAVQNQPVTLSPTETRVEK